MEIKQKKQFDFLYDDKTPFKVIVCCRGGGKTWAVADWCMYELYSSKEPNIEAAFLSKTLKQVKGTLEPILRRWKEALGNQLSYNGSALHYKIQLSKTDTRTLHLLSYENIEAKRGYHPNIIICDEVADLPEEMLNQVLLPMLAPAHERGQANFIAIGTPRSKNLFWKLYERGQDPAYPEWKSWMLKASDSGLISQETQWLLQNNMTEAEYRQEMECDFDANVIVGSIYGEVFNKFTNKNIDNSYDWDPSRMVHTAWDFGKRHYTSIWFFQVKNDQITFIDFYEACEYDLPHFVNEVKAKPYSYGEHYLPWDAGMINIRSTHTISEMLKEYGLRNTVLKNSSVKEGIEEAKMVLKSCRFNATKCEEGIRHLKLYQYQFDTKYGINRDKPCENEHADASDAFRYACIALKGLKQPITNSFRIDNRGGYNTLANNF